MKIPARLSLCLLSLSLPCAAQSIAQPPQGSWKTGTGVRESQLTWTAGPTGRFVAAHGQQAVVMGYPDSGLEIWAYPLQLLSGYQVSFREAGQVEPIDGQKLLRRIEYRPGEIVRVYIGPDFVVREHLFVPMNQPGAILTYQVEGRPQVEIEAHFQPSLNLMWPGALGGQSIQWSDAVSGYIEREPLYGFSATIASPDAVAHDDTVNRTVPLQQGVTLVLKPHPAGDGSRVATLFAASNPPHTAAPGALVQQLESQQAQLQAAAAQHDRDLLSNSLQIVTPDPKMNRSLAWAELALDQAWVCSPTLGCGETAGYGPSRPGRRPQYDWFFGGDGLIAMQGMLAAGEYNRARQELDFITHYQNPANGMIWHEMSQSAALIDWQHKYPYMYVHVDITFQYLAAVAEYVTTTGDNDFVSSHWSNLAAAYRYCQSLISPETHLPQIPAGKEGMNEQDRMRDDLGLSSEWIDAAEGFAQLARVAGHADEAAAADQAAAAARKAIAATDWDAAHHFWLAGHTISGVPIYDERPRPSDILSQQVFSQEQTDQVLDRIASPEFQTDWGTRSMSSASPDFDPNSYSKGSVSALGSAGVAETFWQQHRPLTAWGIWSSLLAWNTLDSEGHIHEVLAGDLFHPEIESVPEQTWSSAGYLSSAVHGLLGIAIESANRRLTLAPHLPAQWNQVSIRNLRVGNSLLAAQITRDGHGMDLVLNNSGAALTLDFSPDLPLGAVLTRSTIDGKPAHVSPEEHPQEVQAHVAFSVPSGITHLHIGYTGGVELALDPHAPALGEASRGIKIVAARFAKDTLTIDAFLRPSAAESLTLLTPWTPASDGQSSIQRLDNGRYELRFTEVSATSNNDGYIPVHTVIHFAR
jgi:glycogen debranching enzyme